MPKFYRRPQRVEAFRWMGVGDHIENIEQLVGHDIQVNALGEGRGRINLSSASGDTVVDPGYWVVSDDGRIFVVEHTSFMYAYAPYAGAWPQEEPAHIQSGAREVGA